MNYLSVLRWKEILVLQGPPLFGAVVAYREPAAISIGALAILTAANLCLMAHVFVVNDWSNQEADLGDPAKAPDVFTKRGVSPGGMATFAAALVAAALGLAATLGAVPFALMVGVAALSTLYSLPPFQWKGRPWLNSAAHLSGGVLHFLSGYAVGSTIDGRGLAIGAFCATTFAAGHLVQELRDHVGDRRHDIRTNAVAFGPRHVFAASTAAFSIAHLMLLSLALTGAIPRTLAWLALLMPLQLWWSHETLRDGLTRAAICRLQRRYRLLFACIGAAVAAGLWLRW